MRFWNSQNSRRTGVNRAALRRRGHRRSGVGAPTLRRRLRRAMLWRRSSSCRDADRSSPTRHRFRCRSIREPPETCEHDKAGCVEHHALPLQQAALGREVLGILDTDLRAARVLAPDHSLPGQPPGTVTHGACDDAMPRWNAGQLRDLSVGRDLAARDGAHDRIDRGGPGGVGSNSPRTCVSHVRRAALGYFLRRVLGFLAGAWFRAVAARPAADAARM
jgi:hypothetical protein